MTRVLQESLRKAEEQLIRACEMANRDPDAQVIEQEFDAIAEPTPEPWDDSRET